ncbi:hypothetical protein, partial [Amycolatopsis sp. H20-H5]|uniref:hypothetical protein n=1 Tax=Amycolatopsis sp. H20-H5 TaxID=3046309 RepID=UPI002DBC7043
PHHGLRHRRRPHGNPGLTSRLTTEVSAMTTTEVPVAVELLLVLDEETIQAEFEALVTSPGPPGHHTTHARDPESMTPTTPRHQPAAGCGGVCFSWPGR